MEARTREWTVIFHFIAMNAIYVVTCLQLAPAERLDYLMYPLLLSTVVFMRPQMLATLTKLVIALRTEPPDHKP